MPTPDSTSSNLPLSPTKIRLAFECPRLLYLGHHQSVKTQFVPPDGIGGVGKPFHAFADRLIQYLGQDDGIPGLLQASSRDLDPTAIAIQIQQQFYQQAFFPYSQTVQQQNPHQIQAIMPIWQGLRNLIVQFTELLVRNRQVYTADQVLQKTFLLSDTRSLDHTFTLPDGSHQKVAGTYDCLVYDAAAERPCVIELKTYAPIDPTAQLAQVAIYSYLLWAKYQQPIDAAVYCVLPSFQIFNYSWEQLEAAVHQLIPHKLQQMQQWLAWEPGRSNPPPPTTQPEHLCPICPQQAHCQTYFEANPTPGLTPIPVKPKTAQVTPQGNVPPLTKAAASVQVPPPPAKVTPPIKIAPSIAVPSPQPIPPAAERQGQSLVDIFAAFGIETTYEGIAMGPAFLRVKLKPQLGVKVSAMTRLSDDLRVHLNLSAPPMIAPQAGFVSVDLPRPDRQIAHFQQYIQHQSDQTNAPLKIAIGIDLDGHLCEADLSDPNTCHFLVGGTTGSGKSEFLKALLLSLLQRHSPKQLKIVLVDPKRVTFPDFESIPWLLTPVIKESDTAIEQLQALVEDMEARYRRFEAEKCQDISGYNQKFLTQPDRQLPRIVCIFDEYADFMAEKKIAGELEQSIKRLGAMARAAGIHLIIATQRPEAKVVTPLIRSNLPGRVALRTASQADSDIILGDKGSNAMNLLGKGDLLYQSSGQLMRLQSLFATASDLAIALQ